MPPRSKKTTATAEPDDTTPVVEDIDLDAKPVKNELDLAADVDETTGEDPDSEDEGTDTEPDNNADTEPDENELCPIHFGDWGAVPAEMTGVGCEHGSWIRPGFEPVEVAAEELDIADGERGMVETPCRKCFPDGWPVEEVGASVSCSHDFAIVYGQPVEITRDRAVELGFLEADPQ